MTWYFPKDAVPGARLHRHLTEQIHKYDRLIVCCSQGSLVHEGVLHEVEEALEREQDEGATEVLIPVLIEDIFGSGRTPPSWWSRDREHVYRALRRCVCAYLTKAKDDPELWSERLGKVLLALRKDPKLEVDT